MCERNLLLVWASGRQRDVAIRLALGATRADIVSERLMRGLVLGAAGGVAGIGCGVWVRDVLITLAPPSVIPHVAPISLNARVLAFSAALSIGVGLAASILPAWQVIRRRLDPTLRAETASVVSARSVIRWRGALVMAEVAAALVLALGAGLLVRSLILLDRVELGFATDRVVTMTVRLPVMRYPDADARLRFFEQLADRVRALPGVQAVAYANQFPMRGGWGGRIRIKAASGPIDAEADLQAVSPDYFSTLGMPILRGRPLTSRDRTGTGGVAVVSQTLADRFLPGEDPLGRVIRRHAAAPALTIVGVVGEVRRDGRLADARPQVYLPSHQTEVYAADLSELAVRTSGDPLAIVPHVRAETAALDPRLVLGRVRTLEEILDAARATRRFHSWLLMIFAVLSVALAIIGVYGVVGYAVAQRTRELGLRVALGASRGHVIGIALASGLRWAAGGIVIGVAAAAGASRLLSSLLFQTTPHDLATFAGVSSFVGLVAAAAAYFPARRAASCDPIAALRAE
jgi:putative ABC transport system permease protein